MLTEGQRVAEEAERQKVLAQFREERANRRVAKLELVVAKAQDLRCSI